ncbi:PaaX family transcriptional regulator [Pararhodobacter marinus]|uniref:PaaX family transcriptional regulator n=1 Tax=Pararhodobacter marinus TaxID=2184063 RepID=A0A2U2C877_9RHOB|nr:PaaX family transcriptional regulator C-terminal domain-containing protein [Pararhodobacter marinus]PWE28063.1 PaaX family transcriptional regulator [Pararhodobacter marinus]
MRDAFSDQLDTIVSALPLRAAGFIVTLYGDAVVPRGGEVWIGTIIETCAMAGISETLVRTAVSRLVAAGQLEGWRRGRRSFYRLSDAARAEFDEASRLIYGPPEPWSWRFVHLPEGEAETRMVQLERQGYARLKPTLAVGPARGTPPKGLLSFDAVPAGAEALLADFAAQAWDLAPHAAAYRALIGHFAPLETCAPGDGAQALAARLLLVHAWRHALLRDPRLPPEALPADWPGHAARDLFHRLYAALSPLADSHIGRRFEGAQGLLPPQAAPLPGAKIEAGQTLGGGVRRTG